MKIANSSLPLAVSSPPENHFSGDGLATPRNGDETAKRAYYPNFDWLRLFLAFSVVLYHVWNATGEKIMAYFFAVPAFLTISGFVVLDSFANSRGWSHFAWKRLLRVAPAFIACLLLTGAVLGRAAIGESLQTWLSFGFIAPKGNGVLWSLGWEEVLYGALAILYLCGAYRKPRLILYGFVVSASIGIALLATECVPPNNVAVILPACFLLGNLAYLWRMHLPRVNAFIPAAVFVFLLATWPLLFGNRTLEAIHVLVMSASVLWFGLSDSLVRFRIPDLSYGLYVYGIPCACLIGTGNGRLASLLTIPIVTVCFSLVSCFCIERPALKLKNINLLEDVRVTISNRVDRRRVVPGGVGVGGHTLRVDEAVS